MLFLDVETNKKRRLQNCTTKMGWKGWLVDSSNVSENLSGSWYFCWSNYYLKDVS